MDGAQDEGQVRFKGSQGAVTGVSVRDRIKALEARVKKVEDLGQPAPTIVSQDMGQHESKEG